MSEVSLHDRLNALNTAHGLGCSSADVEAVEALLASEHMTEVSLAEQVNRVNLLAFYIELLATPKQDVVNNQYVPQCASVYAKHLKVWPEVDFMIIFTARQNIEFWDATGEVRLDSVKPKNELVTDLYKCASIEPVTSQQFFIAKEQL